MTDNYTQAKRPVPRRPRWGWLAWEATVGYIAQHHSPDATLKIQIYPQEHIIGWGASLAWGNHAESVEDALSFPDALNSLWNEVQRHHRIFNTLEDAVRRPANYGDDEWLDTKTNEIFSRLVHVTDTVFQGGWRVILMYRPIETPEKRVNARLLAEHNNQKAGNGITLRDACRNLYHNAAPLYKQHIEKEQND